MHKIDKSLLTVTVVIILVIILGVTENKGGKETIKAESRFITVDEFNDEYSYVKIIKYTVTGQCFLMISVKGSHSPSMANIEC